MQALLSFSRAVDRINALFGRLAAWLVLIACLLSAGNASTRYLFNLSSNAWLEIQWYLFSGMFLLGASYTLKLNEHVRVDLVFMMLSDRGRLWIDIFGILFFLLPATGILTYMTWDFFIEAWRIGEVSANAGGLVRWPVKLLMPLGFGLLTLQGLSELVKRVAALTDNLEISSNYERPLQ